MKLITYPNPILQRPSQPINLVNFGVKKLKKISQQMRKVMKKNKGVGLAAPQVGLNIRFCIASDLVLINPLIIERSSEATIDKEGCLSLPNTEREISRAVRIKIRALNFDNKTYEFEADGLLARIIQHELDHLDGILIIDK